VHSRSTSVGYLLQRACEIQVMAQSGGGRLCSIPALIRAGIPAQYQVVTHGQGGALAWPALLRKLDRLDPSYRE